MFPTDVRFADSTMTVVDTPGVRAALLPLCQRGERFPEATMVERVIHRHGFTVEVLQGGMYAMEPARERPSTDELERMRRVLNALAPHLPSFGLDDHAPRMEWWAVDDDSSSVPTWTPKSLAICARVRSGSRCWATRTTSSRNSLGNGLGMMPSFQASPPELANSDVTYSCSSPFPATAGTAAQTTRPLMRTATLAVMPSGTGSLVQATSVMWWLFIGVGMLVIMVGGIQLLESSTSGDRPEEGHDSSRRRRLAGSLRPRTDRLSV